MSLAEEARDVRRRIAERLRELEPLAREYEELRQVAADLGIELAPAAGDRTRTHARPQTRPSTETQLQPAKRDREGPETERPDAGEVASRVLEAVRSEPGKTVGEYAAILGLAQTTLYRPVTQLTDHGMIVKRARQLFPA
jgi:DNA-binding transcriptional ArsR family regulator